MNPRTKREVIKRSYGNIARSGNDDCCSSGAGCCSPAGQGLSMAENYDQIQGYQNGADLHLGCGIPTEIAGIREGDTVIDLGSGAGNDVFVARELVGKTGMVIGIDMTPEMVVRASQHNKKLGYKNVEFLLADIQDMQVIPSNTADVVISNCVLNLVPGKEKAFNEIHRLLKEGGHFSISDIVYKGKLPEGLKEAAEMYAGCVAGASEKSDYLRIIKSAGFKNIEVKKERPIVLPDDVLLKFLSSEELSIFRKSDSGIYSIAVYADKAEEGVCCVTTGSGCCGGELVAPDQTEANSCCKSNPGSNSTPCCQ